MRFTRSDVKDHIVDPKSTTNFHNSAEIDAAAERSKINFREIFGSFDFRLLQRYRPKADISLASWQPATQPNPPLPEGRSSPIRCPS